jgi:hypothetical protein
MTHFLGGVQTQPITITDAATYTFLKENSGKDHLVPDLTADCTMTLPPVESGLKYELHYTGAAADAQDWIIVSDASDGSTELFKGGVVFHDENIGGAGIEVLAVYADFSNDDTFTVLTPQVGTMIRLICDGTSWIVSGQVVSDTVPTFA